MEFFISFKDQTEQVTFIQSPDTEGLPFPLYLELKWKILITGGLSAGLIYGLKLRTIIISYLRLADVKVIYLAMSFVIFRCVKPSEV